MMLRDHPLMAYKGSRNWPATWMWIDGSEDKHPYGEIGILRAVLLSKIQPANRCLLLISYEGSSYLGSLLFDDPAFCKQIVNLLRNYCNPPIAEIGSIELAHTL
jgi:hypothetical protein